MGFQIFLETWTGLAAKQVNFFLKKRKEKAERKSLTPALLLLCSSLRQPALQMHSHNSLRTKRLIPPQDERDFIQTGQC